MRKSFVAFTFLAAFSWAQSQVQAEPFKPVVYEDPANHEALTLTGPEDAELLSDGEKIVCKYTIKDKRIRIVTKEKKNEQGIVTGMIFVFNVDEEGLSNEDHKVIFLTKEALAKARPAMDKAEEDKKLLGNAKQLGLACLLYATDHDGDFPKSFKDLMPDYFTDAQLFASPFPGKHDAIGYDYFGGKDSDIASRTLLRSKDTTPDGRRIIVHIDGSAELKAD